MIADMPNAGLTVLNAASALVVFATAMLASLASFVSCRHVRFRQAEMPHSTDRRGPASREPATVGMARSAVAAIGTMVWQK